MTRILFFGTAEFAIPSLRALAGASGCDVIGVVSQPDQPKGRGRRLAAPPVKAAAETLGLPVFQPRRLRSPRTLRVFADLSPDYLVVAAYGRILPPELLGVPRLAPVNLHGSLLPAYRGAAPIQRSILAGETVTGVTTIWMNDETDAGDILMARPHPIAEADTAGSLTAALAELGADLLIETLGLVEAGAYVRIAQNTDLATYAPPIMQSDAALDWTETCRRCRDRVRAMAPKPGAAAVLRGHRLKILAATCREGVPADPGAVLGVSGQGVTVGTGCGALLLEEVQPESGRRMSAAEWSRGSRPAVGEKFQ